MEFLAVPVLAVKLWTCEPFIDIAALAVIPPRACRQPAGGSDEWIGLFTHAILILAALLSGLPALARADECAYVANSESRTISVINTAAHALSKTIQLPNGSGPAGIAFTPDGAFAYVANSQSNNVSVIETATKVVVAHVPVGTSPERIGITPDGAFAYVTNSGSDDVSVIDTHTKRVVATVAVGDQPMGIAITPNGTFVYVANFGSDDLSVIDTASNTVVQTTEVRRQPNSVAIAPNGLRAYITNSASNSVSVVDTSSNSVVANIALQGSPVAVAVDSLDHVAHVAFVQSSGVLSLSAIDTATTTITNTISIGDLARQFGFVGRAAVELSPAGTLYVVWTAEDDLIQCILCGLTSGNPDCGAVCSQVRLSAINTTTYSAATTTLQGIGDNDLAIVPSGALAFVVGADLVAVLDLASKAVTDTIYLYLPPERIAAANGANSAQVLNANGTLSSLLLPSGAIGRTTRICGNDLAMNANGSVAYLVCAGGLTIIDTVTRALIKSISLEQPGGVAIAPSGDRVYVTQPAGDQILVLNTATNAISSTILVPLDDAPTGVTMSHNGSFAYVTNAGSSTVSVIDTSTKGIVARISVGTAPDSIAVSASGTGVVANTGSSDVTLINTITNSSSGSIPLIGAPKRVAMTADGAFAYVVVDNEGSGSVWVVSTEAAAVVGVIPVGNGPRGIAIASVNDGCPALTLTPTRTVTSLPISPTPTRTRTPTVSGAISPTLTPTASVSPSTVTPARTIRVSGVVTSAATRARLAGAVMTLAGQTTTTDNNGQYDFAAVDLTAGRTLSAAKTGFSTYALDLTVPIGAVAVTQDIALSPSGSSKPIVTAVRAQYQGLFLGGAQIFNQYAATVNWNGTPGTVEFYANGTLSQVVPGTPSGASAAINMAFGFSGSLSLGVNQLRVIAVNGAGVRSDAFTVPVSIIPLPGFLSEFAALAPFQFIPGNDPQYSFTFAFPDQSAQFLQSLPLLDKAGIDFSVEGGFEYALNSGEWEIHFGTLASPRFNGAATRNLRRPKLSVGDLEVDIGLSAVADGIATQTRGIVPQNVGLQLTLDRTQDIKSFLLSDYVPGAQWLRILDWLKRLGLDINSLQRVTLQGLLKLALQLVAQLDPPPTHFGGFRTPIDLGAQAVYNPDVKAAQGLVKVGGTIGTTLQRPQNPFLEELRAQFFGEVQFTVLSLVVLDEQFAILNYSKDFTAAQALRSGDGTAKDWRVVEGMRRPVRPIARDYLTAGPPRFVANQQAARLSRFQAMSRSRRRGALAVSPTTDMALVENVFPNGQPALASRGSELMVLYVSDNATANPVQFTDINWMRYDGATWSAPQPILADTRGEFSPQVAFDGNGNAVAAWERIKDPNLNTTDVTALLSNVEIVWSRWDRATGTWSLPASLTNNAHLDHDPRLAGPLADGGVLLEWTANTQNRLVGDSSAGAASTDTVRWTKWDPNSQGWSIPQTLVSNLTSRTSQSLAAGGTAAVYAWTTDADGNLDDASDQEVFYSTWTGSGWAAAAQLTHDTVADRNLRAVVAPSGKVFLVWQRGADLVLDRDLASAPEVAHAGTDSIAFTDYALSVGPAENLALMWENQSPDGSDPYYKVYDPASGRWSQDDRLLADSAIERSFAPAWDDAGNLTVAYDRRAVSSGSETITTEGGESITIDNVPQLGPTTDLAVLKRALVKDVGLQTGDFTAQGTDFLPGDSITLSATVRNLGNLPVESLQVAFYDGDPLSGGTEIGRQVIAGFLDGAATTTVTAAWTVPVSAGPHTLYAVVDPDGTFSELNETNNQLSITIGATDLIATLVSKSIEDDGSARVIVQVVNGGAPAAPSSTLAIRYSTEAAAPLATALIPSLDPGSSAQVAIDLPSETVDPQERLFTAAADDDQIVNDANRQNNSVTFAMSVLLPSPTATATPSETPTEVPTATETSTKTPNPTSTHTVPPEPSPTPSPAPTDTPTVAPTATSAPTATQSPQPTSSPVTSSPTSTRTALPTSPAGDANCDGRVSAADFPALVKVIAAQTEGQCTGTNADGRGAIDADDLRATIQTIFSGAR